jgi:hypothetical protein
MFRGTLSEPQVSPNTLQGTIGRCADELRVSYGSFHGTRRCNGRAIEPVSVIVTADFRADGARGVARRPCPRGRPGDGPRDRGAEEDAPDWECEERDADTLQEIGAALKDLPFWLYGPEWTIEDAAENLAVAARARQGGDRFVRMALFVDSIHCDLRCGGGAWMSWPTRPAWASARCERG